MDKLQYGDKVEINNILEVTRIDDVLPVRYNGIDGNYVVCAQGQATHMAILMGGGNIGILLSIECENTYLLADAIVG